MESTLSAPRPQAVNRRTALMSGLAAALGLPLVTEKKENPVVSIVPATEPKPAPAHTDHRPILPCNPKNDPIWERMVILTHALIEDCWRLVGAHGDDCGCTGCHHADGAQWILELMESCLESELRGFYYFQFREPGSARNLADVAERLNLPLWMVKDHFESHRPGGIAAELFDEATNEVFDEV